MARAGKNNDVQAVRAIHKAQSPQDDTITLSSGVVLRGRLMPPLILVQVMASLPRPEPPQVFMEKMGRVMENPDDPDYIERLQSWKSEYSDRLVSAMIALGTEFVSAPKSLGNPDKNDWLTEYSALRLPMLPDSKAWRQLTWVKFKGVMDEQDMNLIQDVVGRLNGVRESTVKSAENFPGSDQTDR